VSDSPTEMTPDTQEMAAAPWEEGTIDPKSLDLREEVLRLNRVSKVVKGGRNFSFSALVVVGDGNGHVGLGQGKANEVPEAIAKAIDKAKGNLLRVPLKGRTVTHEIVGEFGAARVMLKPASEGTGLIAGPAVRAICDLAGIHDLLTKSLGSGNIMNIAKATIQGLQSIKRPEEVARLRGRTVQEITGRRPPETVSTKAEQTAE